MPGDVRERLLGDAEERDLDLRVERDDVAGHRDVGRDAVELGPFAGDVGEGVGQRPRLERGGHRRLDRSAGLGEALARQALGVLEVPVSIGRSVVRLVGRLELGDDPDEALGDRVVDLARHPGALVEDARLAGLGQQLGVEAGVLHERGLELGQRLPALLVLLGDLLADDRRPRR